MREKLACYAHTAWSSWMMYLFDKSILNKNGTVTIPAWAVERWMRQMRTYYDELSENEKNSDREEADQILKIINEKE